jgi:hypothetical protein
MFQTSFPKRGSYHIQPFSPLLNFKPPQISPLLIVK